MNFIKKILFLKKSNFGKILSIKNEVLKETKEKNA